jgi:Flp pilus assembly protein TadD
MADFDKWSFGRIPEWILEKLLSLARHILDYLSALGYWLERKARRVGRVVSKLVRWVANPVRLGLHTLGYWGDRKSRRLSKGTRKVARATARPFAAILGPALYWLSRRLRRVLRWFSDKFRGVLDPLEAIMREVRLWVERRVLRKTYHWLDRRVISYAKKNPITVSVMAVCVLGMLGGLAYWPGLPLYRKAKEERFMALAEGFARKGEDMKALICARHALGYNPKRVEAAELMAGLADRAKSPQTLIWRQRVVELAPTLDNRVRLVDGALRYEAPPFPLAARTLNELSETDKHTVAFHLVSARFAMQLKQLSKAERHYEEAIQLDPTNEQHRLNLAVLGLQSTNTGRATAARAVLENLRGSASLGDDASRWLITDCLRRKDLVAAQRFSEQLLGNPRQVFGDHLTHLSILTEMKSATLGGALQRAQTLAATNAAQAGELGNWMIAHKQAKAAQQWLESLPELVRSRQPVPLTTAACFQAIEDWRGLQQFLQELDWGDQEFIRLALLSRAHRGEGELELAASFWTKASRLATERPEFTAILAQTCRAWGWKAETEELLATLSTRFAAQPWALQYAFQQYHSMGNTQALERTFSTVLSAQSTNVTVRESEALLAAMTTQFAVEPWALWVLEHLMRHYWTTGNTRGVYQVLSATLDRGTDNLNVKNDLATAALLLQTNLPMANTLAQQVYTREPANPAFASTYAYSLYLQGKTADGLKVMQDLKPADLKKPSVATYYGCLLAGAGQSDRARDYLALAETGTLLPEEKALVANAKRSTATPKR